MVLRRRSSSATSGWCAPLRLRTCTVYGIALAAVGPTPIFARAAGDGLVGKAVSDEAIAEAAAAQSAATPISDMRGPADFRTHLVGVLVKRTLEGAIARAKGKFVANAVQEAAG